MTPFLSITGIGRLTKYPEQRNVGQHNSKIVTTSIAVNLRVKGVDGQWKDAPVFYSAIMWGAKGDALSKLAKGDLVYFSGEMLIEEWKDPTGGVKTGQKIELTKIVSLAPRESGSARQSPPPRPATPASNFAPPSPSGAPGGDEDDVPF